MLYFCKHIELTLIIMVLSDINLYPFEWMWLRLIEQTVHLFNGISLVERIATKVAVFQLFAVSDPVSFILRCEEV